MRQTTKIIHIQFFTFFRNFYPNEADNRSSLFSLPFSKVLEWYFDYKKSYMVEKN